LKRKPNNKFALSLREQDTYWENPKGFPNFVFHAADESQYPENPATFHFDTFSLGFPLCSHRYTDPSRYCMVLMRLSRIKLMKINPFVAKNYQIVTPNYAFKLYVCKSVPYSSIHKEKIQQDGTMYRNFIIPHFYEAQHVSGDTPPIIRSLKLHRQPLVFHTWKDVWACSWWTLSGGHSARRCQTILTFHMLIIPVTTAIQ
jgi:hypothetical protein